MKKTSKVILLVLLACIMVLTGCGNGNSKAGEKSDSTDLAEWFAENEAIWRTVENGSWSKDPKDAPTDEDLEKILSVATKSQSAIGWNPYFFVAVRDAEEQKAIIGDAWEGATTEATVTILILADQIADQEHHKDKYEELYMQSPVAYFDTGMASGLLNMSAYSLGYSTHYFASANGTSIQYKDDHSFGFGTYPTPNYDLSRFLDGKNYTRKWGMMDKEYDVKDNVVMIAAVVIGKPDPKVDTKTAVTQYSRPDNWAIWEPDANTPPLQ